jgi:hypothetical protein
VKRWLLFITLLLLPRPAAAQSAPSKDVEVVAAGEPQVVDAFEQRLRLLLREYPVQVRWTIAREFRPRDVFVTEEQAALARIWLDARATSRIVIYLVDDAHERFLVRVVPLESGYDEVARESVGTIVQSSVEALLAGASVGVTRQAAEEQVQAIEPAPKPAPPNERAQHTPPPKAVESKAAPARPSEADVFALDLGYRAHVLDRSPLVLHGPELGVALGVARPEGWQLTAQFALGYRVPVRWSAEGVGASFQGAALRVASGVRHALGPQNALALLLTAGVDWLHVTPRVTSSDERARAAFEVFQPALGLTLEWQLSFSHRLAAWLALGVERDVLGNHFDVQSAGQRRTVLQPWVVSPVASLGLRWWP